MTLCRPRFWTKNESSYGGGGGGGTEDYLQLPLDAALLADPSQNPEICVTNVMGDEIKLVFSEPKDESH